MLRLLPPPQICFELEQCCWAMRRRRDDEEENGPEVFRSITTDVVDRLFAEAEKVLSIMGALSAMDEAGRTELLGKAEGYVANVQLPNQVCSTLTSLPLIPPPVACNFLSFLFRAWCGRLRCLWQRRPTGGSEVAGAGRQHCSAADVQRPLHRAVANFQRPSRIGTRGSRTQSRCSGGAYPPAPARASLSPGPQRAAPPRPPLCAPCGGGLPAMARRRLAPLGAGRRSAPPHCAGPVPFRSPAAARGSLPIGPLPQHSCTAPGRFAAPLHSAVLRHDRWRARAP